MTQSKASIQDPVKTVEGMFNGTLARLGQFFKDPKNYGANTKAVLSETAKRYQDALDDCEIQILEAKWYLEHLLEVNRARRKAALEKAEAPSIKRKLDEMERVENTIGGEDATEKPLKRPRLEENTSVEPTATREPQAITEITAAVSEQPDKEVKEKTNPDKPETTEPASPKPPPKPSESTAEKSAMDISVAPEEPSAPAPAPVALPESRPSTSAGRQLSTQGTPANDDFINFESMFGEPSDEANDTNFNFNLDLDNEASNINTIDFSNQDPSSINSLLESYTNQSSNNLASNNNMSSNNNDTQTANTTTNNFDLPEMPNSFDDFLNENNMGEDFGNADGADDFLDGENLMNIDDLDMSFLNEK